ncbi:hypothetical protein N0V85_009908, partial [Neurospora sp. IMI 360204]
VLGSLFFDFRTVIFLQRLKQASNIPVWPAINVLDFGLSFEAIGVLPSKVAVNQDVADNDVTEDDFPTLSERHPGADTDDEGQGKIGVASSDVNSCTGSWDFANGVKKDDNHIEPPDPPMRVGVVVPFGPGIPVPVTAFSIPEIVEE